MIKCNYENNQQYTSAQRNHHSAAITLFPDMPLPRTIMACTPAAGTTRCCEWVNGAHGFSQWTQCFGGSAPDPWISAHRIYTTTVSSSTHSSRVFALVLSVGALTGHMGVDAHAWSSGGQVGWHSVYTIEINMHKYIVTFTYLHFTFYIYIY